MLINFPHITQHSICCPTCARATTLTNPVGAYLWCQAICRHISLRYTTSLLLASETCTNLNTTLWLVVARPHSPATANHRSSLITAIVSLAMSE